MVNWKLSPICLWWHPSHEPVVFSCHILQDEKTQKYRMPFHCSTLCASDENMRRFQISESYIFELISSRLQESLVDEKMKVCLDCDVSIQDVYDDIMRYSRRESDCGCVKSFQDSEDKIAPNKKFCIKKLRNRVLDWDLFARVMMNGWVAVRRMKDGPFDIQGWSKKEIRKCVREILNFDDTNDMVVTERSKNYTTSDFGYLQKVDDIVDLIEGKPVHSKPFDLGFENQPLITTYLLYKNRNFLNTLHLKESY